MQCERESNSLTTIRAPSHWVPQEVRVVETYPIYPPHPVRLLDGIDVSNDFATIINRVTRHLAERCANVTGGPPRTAFVYEVDFLEQGVERRVRSFLAGLADRCDKPAHDHFIALLNEYPVNACTNYIEAVLLRVHSSYCPICGADFDPRRIHRCDAADVARQTARRQ